MLPKIKKLIYELDNKINYLNRFLNIDIKNFNSKIVEFNLNIDELNFDFETLICEIANILNSNIQSIKTDETHIMLQKYRDIGSLINYKFEDVFEYLYKENNIEEEIYNKIKISTNSLATCIDKYINPILVENYDADIEIGFDEVSNILPSIDIHSKATKFIQHNYTKIMETLTTFNSKIQSNDNNVNQQKTVELPENKLNSNTLKDNEITKLETTELSENKLNSTTFKDIDISKPETKELSENKLNSITQLSVEQKVKPSFEIVLNALLIEKFKNKPIIINSLKNDFIELEKNNPTIKLNWNDTDWTIILLLEYFIELGYFQHLNKINLFDFASKNIKFKNKEKKQTDIKEAYKRGRKLFKFDDLSTYLKSISTKLT